MVFGRREGLAKSLNPLSHNPTEKIRTIEHCSEFPILEVISGS